MSLEIVSPSTQGATNIKSTPLSKLLLFPDFFSLFGENSSFLDLYLFGKSLEETQPALAARFLSRLDFRQVVDERLSGLGISPEPFWKAMKESDALLHGSFLLSCLLDPISGKQNKIFTEDSDIDILEPRFSKKDEICPSCLRKLHGKLFPNKICSMKVVETDLLGLKKNHPLMEKKKHLFSLIKDNAPDGQWDYFMPHIYQRDATLNSLGKYLCYQNKIYKDPKFNYTEMFESHFIWGSLKRDEQNSVKILIDQCTIAVKNKEELLEWVPKHVDFAFGKVVYDGEKLTIFDLPSLLSRSSPFPDVEKIDKLELQKYMWSSVFAKDEKCSRINQLWERSLRYEKKGFKVLLSTSQALEVQKAIEYHASRQ